MKASFYILNLAELYNGLAMLHIEIRDVMEAVRVKHGVKPEIIEIGSNFCGQYFLKTNMTYFREIIRYCRETGTKLRIVVPVFSQSELPAGKKLVKQMAEESGEMLDGIVANDYAMMDHLHCLSSCKLYAGRLFFKNVRDPREDVFRGGTQIMPDRFTRDFFHGSGVQGVEIDTVSQNVSFAGLTEEYTVGVHYPYGYMTTGRICEFASVGLAPQMKFRPDTPCGMRCMSLCYKYRTASGDEFIKSGRTVYFDNRKCETAKEDRWGILWWPLDEIMALAKKSDAAQKTQINDAENPENLYILHKAGTVTQKYLE